LTHDKSAHFAQCDACPITDLYLPQAILDAADNYVDLVTNMACKLAKERGSKVLETRDLQMVVERAFNQRIPGYTSDELRTVRKVQPSANWIAKMSAIQAAKVTSTKDDK
jgi:transcription initiation factor TFIID subunit 12